MKSLEPDWIWLPNELIDGVSGDVASPLELVRRTQDVLALRLLVDLYHGQNLAENGGLHWKLIRRNYEREKLAENGPFVIWWFSPGADTCWPHQPQFAPHFRGEQDSEERKRASADFWTRWGTLVSLGLVEEIPHLIEADTEDAEPIHAYAIRDGGEQVERDLAAAAQAAALAMLPANLAETYRGVNLIMVPVPFEYRQVQMVGMYRLKYRPKNARTGAWWARLQEEGPKMVERFRALGRTSVGIPSAAAKGRAI